MPELPDCKSHRLFLSKMSEVTELYAPLCGGGAAETFTYRADGDINRAAMMN